MNKFRLTVNTPNKIFYIKNKPLRSPFSIEVFEKELKKIKVGLIANSIDDYSISEIDEEILPIQSLDDPKITDEKLDMVFGDTDPTIEEIGPSSILDELLDDEEEF